MTRVERVTAKRHFKARYINVGRAMLGTLADLYCVDVKEAGRWADEIDRESEIAGGVTDMASAATREGAPLSPPATPIIAKDVQ